MSKKEKKVNPAKRPGAMVYVGPNLSGELLISSYAVFKGGYPPHVQARMDSDPDFAGLFVPVAELSSARRKMADANHRLSKLAAKVRKQGGNK